MYKYNYSIHGHSATFSQGVDLCAGSSRGDFKVCCFDIETTNLSADFGVVLCAVSKLSGQAPFLHSQRTGDTWAHRSDQDAEVVADLLAELDRADFWVAHNGRDFDLPFLQTRAAFWNLPFPDLRPLLDPVIVARRRFRLGSNRLEALARYFRLPRKTPLDPQTWMLASLAHDVKAMQAIEKHCFRDVEILCRLAPFFRGAWRHLGSTGTFY